MAKQTAFILGFVLGLLAAPVASAGEYNPTLDIGAVAPDWQGLVGVDDEKYSLEDFKAEVLVIVFTCNSCPYAVDYEDRIIALAEQYKPEDSEKEASEDTPDSKRDAEETSRRKVQVVAINVNKVEEDLLPAMKKRAEEKEFNFPYLFDESQQSARDYGATFTPEFFVLNNERKIVYMGSLDDSPDAKKAKRHHVLEAIKSTFADEEVEIAETVAIGCRVRLERTRRRSKPKRVAD